MMTHDEMVLRVATWMNKTSKVVLRDAMRTINKEQPDVMAWKTNISILVEVKTTRADFLADKRKSFRKNPEEGMGDWRFYACEPGVIKVSDLPEDWGLIYVTPKTVRKIHGWPPNTRWYQPPFYNRSDKKSEINMLTCALTRLHIKGCLDSIYDKDYNNIGKFNENGN